MRRRVLPVDDQTFLTLLWTPVGRLDAGVFQRQHVSSMLT